MTVEITPTDALDPYEGMKKLAEAINDSGGLTGFTASLDTTAPNDTVNASVLAASGGTPDQDAVVAPKGVGAFALVDADGTTVGGNKRGAYAVDLQTFRDGYFTADMVASGEGSFACGGDNIASGEFAHVEGTYNSASDTAAHAEGYENVASSYYCHAEGQSCTASGNSSHAEGFDCTASGSYSHAEGYESEATGNWSSHAEGYDCTASGTYGAHAEGYECTAGPGYCSHVEGGYATASGDYSHAEGYQTLADGIGSQAAGLSSWTRGIGGNQSYASNQFSVAGDAQECRLGVNGQTTDATPVVLTSDGNAAAANNQMVLVDDETLFASVYVLGKVAGQSDCFAQHFEVLIQRGTGAASTAIPTTTATTPASISKYATSGASSWSVALSADTTNGALAVTVTGAADTTINWTAEIRTRELVF
jgi:hypothetical protein